MAAGGDTVTCAELELRSNRLAHFLRASGLRRLDHYAIFIENNTLMSNAAAPASAWASTTPASARIRRLRPDLGLPTRIHRASTPQLAAGLPRTLSDLPTPNYTTAGVRKGPGGTTLWKRSGCWHSPMG